MQISNNTEAITSSANIGNKNKMKRPAILLFIAICVFLAALFLWPSAISREEARIIALEYVGGGRANRPSRDFEALRRVWSVEVFYDNLVHEVYVNSRTGEVVRVEIDRWD